MFSKEYIVRGEKKKPRNETKKGEGRRSTLERGEKD